MPVQLHRAYRLELVALLQANGEPFDLFATLAAQAEQESEVQVRIHEGITGTPPRSH